MGLPAGRTGIPNPILAVSFVIFAEVMYFAALLSAWFVTRSYASSWPPMGQPRLPLGVSTANTLVLAASGWFAWASMRSGAKARRNHLLALAGGVVFLAVQGSEWARMLRFGMAPGTGTYGDFFYLLIGSHGIHALAGIAALAALIPGTEAPGPGLRAPHLRKAACLFWLFVAGLWPILYILLYLA